MMFDACLIRGHVYDPMHYIYIHVWSNFEETRLMNELALDKISLDMSIQISQHFASRG